MTEPLVIGITGIIGSGKSILANVFEDKGYKVIYTDVVAKNIFNTNELLKKKIIAEFGYKSYRSGPYNSDYMSYMIFEHTNAAINRQKLHKMIHPLVIDAMIELTLPSDTDELITVDTDKLIFVESALIYELGIDAGFDYIITVVADLPLCISRVQERSHFEVSTIKKIIKTQLTQEEKKRRGDFVIENNKSVIELQAAANSLLSILLMLPHRKDEEDDNTGAG